MVLLHLVWRLTSEPVSIILRKLIYIIFSKERDTVNIKIYLNFEEQMIAVDF